MSSYEYTHTSGSSLLIRDSSYPDRILLRVGFNNSKEGMHIPSADVPTVALELLKAAGQESVIVPKAYEEVVDKGNGRIECGGGPESAFGEMSMNPNWLYNRAANYVALAQYIEGAPAREAAEKAEAEAAEKKLQERRDALAKELSEDRRTYSETSLTAQAAINHIIELEDKLAFRD